MSTSPDTASSKETIIEDAGPCRKRFRVHVGANQVTQEFRDAFKEISKQVRIPGFRPGKVPRAVLEKRFGGEIQREIKERVLNAAISKALKEHEIQPIGDLDGDFETVTPKEGEDLDFAFEIDVRPAPVVETWKGIEVQAPAVSVAEGEIDEALENFARRSAVPQELEEGEGLRDPGIVRAKVTFRREGNVVHETEELTLGLDNPIKGVDETEWTQRLTGTQAGQIVTIPLIFRDGFPVEDVIGLEGEAEIAIEKAYNIMVPPVEELAERADFADVEGYRDHVRNEIRKAKEDEKARIVERQVLAKLAEQTDFDIPDRLVQREVDGRIEDLKQRLAQGNVPEEEAATRIARERPQVEQQVIQSYKEFFIVEAIGKQEKVFVTETEVGRELESIAQRNQSTTEEVRGYYEENELMGTLRSEILERKVRAMLREHAVESEIEVEEAATPAEENADSAE